MAVRGRMSAGALLEPREKQEMTIAATIRESLLSGDEWSADLFTERFPGRSPSNLHGVIREMRQEGHEFVTRPVSDSKPPKLAYTLAAKAPRAPRGAERVVTALGDLPDVATLKPAPKPTPTPTAIRQSSHHEFMVLVTPSPEFGDSLRVVLLSEGEDGTITVGLRNGEVTYVAELVGAHVNTHATEQQ